MRKTVAAPAGAVVVSDATHGPLRRTVKRCDSEAVPLEPMRPSGLKFTVINAAPGRTTRRHLMRKCVD